MNRLFVSALILVGWSCSSDHPNKFSDPTLVRIYEYKDKRQTDSLYQFFNSEKSSVRQEAVLAFASIQDTLASQALGTILLEDSVADVRQAAAFALGQTKGFLAVNSLIPAASDKDAHVSAEALEALGKSISKKDIDVLNRFKSRDTLVQAGLVWGFYQAGSRGLADSLMIERCQEFLKPSYSVSVRLGAAHFFNRSTMLPTQAYRDGLIKTAIDDKNAFVRMAATSGLRKITSPEVLEALKKIIASDVDYRVRSNEARALAAFPFEQTQEALLKALKDENINVAIAASESIRTRATENFFQPITEAARACNNWRVQANLFETALGLKPEKELIAEVESDYTNSKNDYQKAWLLNALSKAIETYPFIQEELFKSSVPVIKSSAAQALVAINHHKDFSPSLKKDFSVVYEKALLNGDAGVIVSVAGALSDSTLDYRSVISDVNFLYETRKKLSLPKDIEALQPLEEAIAYFEHKKKPTAPKNEYNHPINWKLTSTISKDQKILLKTSKGDIILRLLVEEAPGSATSFVELCHQKYFDGKFFHRVVPNFVVQAGCNRGDGYGSEAWSIRSEFSQRRYSEGSVGMASAGKDTEGMQWFITHSPTPHLDGRYTIFAEVERGMSVVHQIEVGDIILSATLVDN